jgi:Lipocalin-like domain
MNRRTTLTLSTMALLCLGVALPSAAVAQTAKDLVGSWTLVSSVNTRPDGSKEEGLGPNPKGIQSFESSGRFVVLNLRSGLPKFASNDRNKGTPEENKAIVQGSIGLFGIYSVADKVVTLKVEASTWPGYDGTDQKRTITSFTGDDLKWTIATGSTGAKTEQTWKRAK